MKKKILICLFICFVVYSCNNDDNETQKYNVIVESYNNSMGYTTGSGVYPYGSTATIQALAQNNCRFEMWSDGDTTNPKDVFVTKDLIFRAFFRYQGEPSMNDSTGYVNINTSLMYGLWHMGTNYWRFKEDGSGVIWDVADDITEEESDLKFTWCVFNYILRICFPTLTESSVVIKEYYLVKQTSSIMVYEDIYGQRYTLVR